RSRNEVRITLKPDGDKIRVEIADSGHGIPPDILGRIFEPFFTTKPVGIGTGLGLSISQTIVNGMKGELLVESQVGRGATFVVLLPLPQATSTTGSAIEEDVVPVQHPLTAARVLVVDDETALALALKKTLERDHEVTAVTTGRTALDMLL